MDVFGVQNEYEWIVKILKSSKSMTHIMMTDKLLSFFLKKWDGILNEDQKTTFLYDFMGIKLEIVSKIVENHPII
jgi:hypothetical protein